MNNRLERHIEWVKKSAEKSDADYEVSVNTDNGLTRMSIESMFENFRVVLGPRGGLKNAEYNTSGWGGGDFVGEKDTKKEAFKYLRLAIKNPYPIENE